MLDVTLIRQRPDTVRDALRKRALDADTPAFPALDAAFREARTAVERLRGERRRISADIAVRRRAGEATEEFQAAAGALAGRWPGPQAGLDRLARRRRDFLDAPPAFGFAPKDHVQLAQDLGLVDHGRQRLVALPG